jgi:2-C-methyl-D-erythritol 2,4-cyclodiphosphate synthase
MRIGTGYDVHRLEEGRELILGGVRIPFEKGLLGHSDADVLVHAIMDALLGAAALGDIGQHFPDSDPAYLGISSIELLIRVRNLLEDRCYLIENIDATIIAQKPKLASYLPEMVQNIADALGMDKDCVNIKATTEEGLGFSGAGLGIAANAVCLIESMFRYQRDLTSANRCSCDTCEGCNKK